MEQLRKIIPILSQSPRLEGASTEDGSKILFLISQQKHIYCDHLLKLSRRDGSSEGSQYMFLWSSKDIYPKIIPVTPSYLDHWIHKHFRKPQQLHYDLIKTC